MSSNPCSTRRSASTACAAWKPGPWSFPGRAFPCVSCWRSSNPPRMPVSCASKRSTTRTKCPASATPSSPSLTSKGLRLDEAMHDLTLMATGLYGRDLSPQNGAPLRLVVPWKYGFKSIKSIVKIDLVGEMPTSLWMASGPSEYGFYANVNPNVPHPRWSQATERRIGESGRIDTQLYQRLRGRSRVSLRRHGPLHRLLMMKPTRGQLIAAILVPDAPGFSAGRIAERQPERQSHRSPDPAYWPHRGHPAVNLISLYTPAQPVRVERPNSNP